MAMNKFEAIIAIAREFDNMKPTRTSYARCKRACKVLGLSLSETKAMMYKLFFATSMIDADKEFIGVEPDATN